MWKVKLSNFHADIDGEYELDWEFTKSDWRVIKKMADVTPLEIVRELKRGNVDLVVALAAVALKQAEKPYIDEILWKDDGEIALKEEEDPDAVPPALESLPEPTSAVATSGSSTDDTSARSQETTNQNGSGNPGSDTTADSDQETSPTSPHTS